jgi:molybdopterin synthase sulfur carrier subunit
MKITLRFFASLREALGPSAELLVDAGSTVAQVRDQLIAQGEAQASALAWGRAVRCALNQTLCDETAVLSDGDELAFFPPVTGG